MEDAEPTLGERAGRLDNRYVSLPSDIDVRTLGSALALLGHDPALRETEVQVDDDAVKQLKFADLLPPDIARACLARRNTDPQGATAVLGRTLHIAP